MFQSVCWEAWEEMEPMPKKKWVGQQIAENIQQFEGRFEVVSNEYGHVLTQHGPYNTVSASTVSNNT